MNKTMRFISRVIAEDIISHITGTEVFDFIRHTAPRYTKEERILYHWDILIYDIRLKKYYFIRICYANRYKEVKQELQDKEIYINEKQGVRYFLITYKKHKNQDIYKAEELSLEGDSVKTDLVMDFKGLDEINKEVI